MFIFLALGPTGSARQRRTWWQDRLNHTFVTFDWNCASEDAVNGPLLAKVRRAIPEEDRGSMWGDRAVSASLSSGQPRVLFIPTVCGATGNCTWRLYDSRTTRHLGELGGQFFYVHGTARGWPMLVTYTHMGACEGILARYEYSRGRYRWMQDDYAVNCTESLKREPLPGGLGKARRLCDKYGN